jgi:hypothetical protein
MEMVPVQLIVCKSRLVQDLARRRSFPVLLFPEEAGIQTACEWSCASTSSHQTRAALFVRRPCCRSSIDRVLDRFPGPLYILACATNRITSECRNAQCDQQAPENPWT